MGPPKPRLHGHEHGLHLLDATQRARSFGYSEWYDKDFSVAFSITALVDGADSGKRYVLINWKNSAGSSIASPQTISGQEIFTAYYRTQHYLNVNTNPSDLNPQPDVSPSGSWYDIGTLVTCTAHTVARALLLFSISGW